MKKIRPWMWTAMFLAVALDVGYEAGSGRAAEDFWWWLAGLAIVIGCPWAIHVEYEPRSLSSGVRE